VFVQWNFVMYFNCIPYLIWHRYHQRHYCKSLQLLYSTKVMSLWILDCASHLIFCNKMNRD